MKNLRFILSLALLAVVCAVCPGLSETSLPNGGWDAAWSTDGATIAFTSGSPHSLPNLWLVKADKTGFRQMTTRGAHQPVWMRDGNTIVFGTLRKGKPTFMTIQADGEPGSEKTYDVLPAGAEAPSWSPDGSLVAYGLESKNGKSRDLAVARTGGGGSTVLSTNFWCREWAWSPDGNTIAFVVGRSTGTSIWTVDVPTKKVRLLYKGFCNAPRYSPDGKRLAIAIPDVRSGFKISIIDLASGLDKRIGVRTFNGQDLIWSPDGKFLYFMSNRKSEPAIWSVGTDGKNIIRITSQGIPSMSPALSPDGTKLAYQVLMTGSYSPELSICSTTGRILAKLTTTTSPSYWAPVWSPDGKQFAFQTDVNHASEIVVGTPTGRMNKPCVQTFSSDPAEVSWFPDGKKLLVADSGQLLVVNPAGGKDAAKPLSKLVGQVQSPRLIGDEVIVTEWGMRNAFISAFKLDGSARRYLTQKPEEPPAPEPKNDSQKSLKTEKASRLVQDERADVSAPSNVGAGPTLVAEAETGNPHSDLGQMGPQADTNLNQKPPVTDLWPAVSPDHKSVAFVRNNQLWIVNIDGAGERQITKFAPPEGATITVANPCWSPKGDSLLFLTFNSTPDSLTLEIRICQTEAGSEQCIYSEKVDTEYGVFYSGCTNPPVFMADTNRIIFTSLSSGEPRIVSIGLDGSDLREIVAAPSSFPAQDSSGKKLAYVDLSNDQERIRIMDLATGKQTSALFKK